jgi:hypothetical protein
VSIIHSILIGLAILAVTLPVALQRRQGQWPREGHGATYFARHSLRE